MTTVINEGDSSGSNALSVVFALVVIAALGLGVYYFAGNNSGSSTSTTINTPAPEAPSAPAAPAAPASN